MASAPFDPRDPRVRLDPYPVYREMRDHGPITFVASARAWFVTSHKLCLTVLSDARFSAQQGQQLRLRSTPLPMSMLTTDPPEHNRLRASAAPAFEPAAINRSRVWMRPIIEEAVRRLCVSIESGAEADLVTELAEPVAVTVLGRFLGLGFGELSTFASWGRDVAINLDPFADPPADGRDALAMREMLERFADLLYSPVDPFGALAVLAHSHVAGLASAKEALATAALLVVGGLEPLVSMVTNAAAALLVSRRNGGRDGRVRTIVDELLRFDAPIQFTARRATEDVQLGGQAIAAGDNVVVLLGAANRDPGRFDDPDRLVPDRRTNPHLSFGAGPHACLGAPLARLFAELLVRALPSPLPAMTIRASGIVRSPAAVPRGYLHLPVSRAHHS